MAKPKPIIILETVTAILDRELSRINLTSKERPLDMGEIEKLNLLCRTFSETEPKNATQKAARTRGQFIKDDEHDLLKYAQVVPPKV